MVLQLTAQSIPVLNIGVEDRGKKGIKNLCFAYVPICVVIIIIK